MFRRVMAGALIAVAVLMMPAVGGAASAVRTEVQVVKGGKAGNLIEYLDQWLEEKGWPEHDTILLLVFPDHNWDVRFALGSDFRAEGVTPAEVTALLRVHYFPRVRAGNPAGGLATFMRQIDRRMAAE